MPATMLASLPVRSHVARLVLGGALAFALSGCISLGKGKLPDTLFAFTAERSAAAGTTVSASADSALVVFDPDVDRTLAVQRVAVTVDESHVAYLRNALWVERPAHLFGALLTETLRAKGTRLVLAGDERGSAVGHSRLTGHLQAMGYDAPSHAVVVRYDAVHSETGGAVTMRRFESRVPVRKDDAATIGPALNRAANAVAGQVADWLD
ncbi:MAG TPA: ABC-type transport auxiliary lipoprotein family protein [Novosphingobium sp.]